MALIILEGLDRTGKSSVAKHYEGQGYEVVHQSAPAKDMTADNYLEEQVKLVSSAAAKNLVLDRSYYGELVWPSVYGRTSLLTPDGLESLRELENSVGTTRFLMVDKDVAAHWKRCVDNGEPMDKRQFVQARELFAAVAKDYGFVKRSLLDFPNLVGKVDETLPPPARPVDVVQGKLTKEQIKLETANAINDVMSKRILKAKGPIYDHLENSLRAYLNNELAKIFGTKAIEQFTEEETELLKFFCGKLKKEMKP